MAKIVSKTEITLTRVIDVASNMRYYKLQSSTAAAPSKPTVNPPFEWSTTEPSYTSGSTNTLYFVDCTIYSNGTFKYSDVSKSSSYEAAKEAYNKAQAAQDSVDKTRQEFTDYQSSITNELGTIRTDASETRTILDGKISDLSELIGDIEGIDPDATVAKILKTYSSSIVQNSTDITAIINKQYQTSADVNGIVDAKALSEREYLQTYLRFNESGLTLGKSDSDFLAVLTNTMLAFRQSGLDVAYISNLALYITQAIIKERLVFGADRSDKQQFVWSFGDTGTLDLTYEGE